MHNLELSYTELHTLKTILMSDIECSAMEIPDFSDETDMFFYYERAKLLKTIKQEMGEPT